MLYDMIQWQLVVSKFKCRSTLVILSNANNVTER